MDPRVTGKQYMDIVHDIKGAHALIDKEGEKLSDADLQKMYDAYHRIFTRCGLTFRAVEADTGLIGGTSSHEFMVLAETGEETVVYTDDGT
ncbi:MAG: hypothetical protein C4294_08635, partial [Nitrospiraceae bacterium]